MNVNTNSWQVQAPSYQLAQNFKLILLYVQGQLLRAPFCESMVEAPLS